MLGVKIIIYAFIFLTSSGIGLLISKKYEQRVNELKEIKNALNMFKTKIKFTYEPIPEIFNEISKSFNSKTGKVFEIASCNMKLVAAGEAWNMAIDCDILDINEEDKIILKELSKLLRSNRCRRTNKSDRINKFFFKWSDKKSRKRKRKKWKNV